jgi:putative peptidoglycan lipid II flippase
MLLVNYMGIGGLALAASIAAIIISSLLLRQINKRIVGVINKEIIVYAIKIVVCCILMGIIVVITRDMLYYKLEGNTVIYRLIKFGIPVFVGATFYGILTYVLRIKEARFAVEAIANKLKRM